MNSTSFRSPFHVFLWVILPVVLLGLLVARVGIEVSYAGRVYPGVQALGLDLGGKTVEEAAAQLRTRLDVYGNQTVKVVAGDQTYTLTARDLGFKPNAYAMATAAYQAGRVGDLV